MEEPMLLRSCIAGIAILSVLPLLFFIARLIAKRSKRLSWAIDDTLLIFALFCLYIVVAAFIVSMAVRLVRQHISHATMEQRKRTLTMLWLFRIPMATGLALTRCAISVFFIRTFYTKAYPWLRNIAYLCVFVCIALGFITILGPLLHCRPIKYNFKIPLDNPRYCVKLQPLAIILMTVGVALDGLIWLLPHCVVWRLQLRLAHKLAITVIFAFGLLNIVIGGCRINSLRDVSYQGDVTYSIGATWMWAVAQLSTGIIVSCCPHLRPIFEVVISCQLTCTSICRLQTSQPRRSSIMVTTKIHVQDKSHLPPPGVIFHDGHHEPWAPTFDVEQGPAAVLQYGNSCCGGSRGYGCL